MDDESKVPKDNSMRLRVFGLLLAEGKGWGILPISVLAALTIFLLSRAG